MTPTGIKEKIVAQRLGGIEEMLRHIRALPLETYDLFVADPRNVAAADSYRRRALEALMDLGRHIVAKGFGRAVTEYRDIARQLLSVGALNEEETRRMGELAGYRNRLVHFYAEVTHQELYRICSAQLEDVHRVAEALAGWIRSHPELIDRSL